jgi:predicted RNase H-like nuclease
MEDEVERALTARLARTAEELFEGVSSGDVLSLDVPIGLPGSGTRACDDLARQLLGRRASSVFPAPLRGALSAPTRLAADGVTRDRCGRGVSAQAWAIYHRVLTIDRCMTAALQAHVFEVHPELSFQTMNRGLPLGASKHVPEGLAERKTLVGLAFGATSFAAVRALIPAPAAADDDILDAFAALWTARRLRAREAVGLPAVAQRDALGLRMQIWY